MIWAAARIGFLFLLATTLFTRLHSIGTRDETMASFKIARSIESVVQDAGFNVFENSAKPPSVLSDAILFQRDSCPNKSVVLPFNIGHEALPLLNRLLPEQNYEHVFAYLEHTWPEQDRIQMLLEWLRQTARNLFGASKFVPVKIAIVLAEPASCFGSHRFDWSSIWDRTRAGARAAPSANAARIE